MENRRMGSTKTDTDDALASSYDDGQAGLGKEEERVLLWERMSITVKALHCQACLRRSPMRHKSRVRCSLVAAQLIREIFRYSKLKREQEEGQGKTLKASCIDK